MKKNSVSFQDYPFGQKRKEIIRTLTGKLLEEITLAAVLNGELTAQDVRISPHTLLLQAEIADLAGRKCLANNFRRAAELCHLPDDKIMEIYNALRPYRCTKKQLESIATELEQNHNAVLNAKLVREAARAYEQRNFLKDSRPD